MFPFYATRVHAEGRQLELMSSTLKSFQEQENVNLFKNLFWYNLYHMSSCLRKA